MISHIPLRAASALVVAAFALPAAAQEQPGNIVVTGAPLPSPKEARSYVGDISHPTDGQLARFHDPVCPDVIGIAPEFAARMTVRLREVAEQVGATLDKPGCAANIMVVIAPDGRQFLEGLRKGKPAAFHGMPSADIDRLFASSGPVRAFAVDELRDEAGHSVGDPAAPLAGNRYSTVTQARSASLITLPTIRATLRVVVVLDEQATVGKGLNQLADYAVMRALGGAHPPVRDGTSRDTILTLFDAGVTPPRGLTRLDLAYLQGVYRAPANTSAVEQENAIARSIVRAAGQPAPGAQR